MRNYFAPGHEIEFVASGTVNSGDIIVAGSLVGIAAKNYVNNELGVMEIDGIFRLTKATGQTWGLGAPVYKTAASQVVTTTAGGGAVFMGYAAAANPDSASTVGYVLLGRPGVPA